MSSENAMMVEPPEYEIGLASRLSGIKQKIIIIILIPI
jgi:hypothetical protein